MRCACSWRQSPEERLAGCFDHAPCARHAQSRRAPHLTSLRVSDVRHPPRKTPATSTTTATTTTTTIRKGARRLGAERRVEAFLSCISKSERPRGWSGTRPWRRRPSISAQHFRHLHRLTPLHPRLNLPRPSSSLPSALRRVQVKSPALHSPRRPPSSSSLCARASALPHFTLRPTRHDLLSPTTSSTAARYRNYSLSIPVRHIRTLPRRDHPTA